MKVYLLTIIAIAKKIDMDEIVDFTKKFKISGTFIAPSSFICMFESNDSIEDITSIELIRNNPHILVDITDSDRSINMGDSKLNDHFNNVDGYSLYKDSLNPYEDMTDFMDKIEEIIEIVVKHGYDSLNEEQKKFYERYNKNK